MKSRRTYEVTCQVCGKTFISHSILAMYCPPCKIKVNEIQTKERRRAQEARAKAKIEYKVQRREENMKSLTEIVKEAEKHNMTYGQYVGMTEGINGLH